MPTRLARRFAPFVLVSTMGPSLALAQASTAEIERQKQAALALAEQGDKHLQAAELEKAIEAFAAADRAFHAPTFLIALAEARTKAGRLLAARGTYEAIVAEKLASYAPRAFFEAQDKARTALGELDKRIPRLTIEKGSWPAGATVTLGGRALTQADLGTPMTLDPGTVGVEAKATGKVAFRRSIVLLEGARETVRLEWLEEAEVPPTPAVTPERPSPPPTADSSSPAVDGPRAPESGAPVLAYVAFGLAGAAAAGGTYLAVRTVGLRNDFDANPTQGAYDDAQTSALLTDVAFGAALGLGLAGGVILWMDGGDTPHAQASWMLRVQGSSLSATVTY